MHEFRITGNSMPRIKHILGATKTKSAIHASVRHLFVEVSGLEPKVKPLPENLDLLISIAYICRWS